MSKNPRQLKKSVAAADMLAQGRVAVTYVDDPVDITDAMAAYLVRIVQNHSSVDGEPISVDVLGRYNFDRKHVPR